MKKSNIRVATDVGGTFTDLVCFETDVETGLGRKKRGLCKSIEMCAFVHLSRVGVVCTASSALPRWFLQRGKCVLSACAVRDTWSGWQVFKADCRNTQRVACLVFVEAE